jgi:hypothetical protein
MLRSVDAAPRRPKDLTTDARTPPRKPYGSRQQRRVSTDARPPLATLPRPGPVAFRLDPSACGHRRGGVFVVAEPRDDTGVFGRFDVSHQSDDVS